MKPFNRLLVCVAALSAAHPLSAQEHPHAKGSAHDLEEIIVTASLHNKTEAEVAGSLNVINARELETEASSTLGETLKNQLGVQSSSFGTGVGLPVIRGQSGRRVEVLQNGLAVIDASETSADHAIASDAFLADRIEILRGPSTLRYGGGAIGGVVNVIDNRIHDNYVEGGHGSVSARYDENDQSRVIQGKFDLGVDNWMLHADGTARQNENVSIPGFANEEADDADETTDGFIDNSDADASSFGIGISRVGDWGSAGFTIAEIKNNYGIPPGAHGHEEEGGDAFEEEEEEEETVRIDLDQTLYQARAVINGGGGFIDHVDVDLSYSDYTHQEIEFEGSESEIGTRFDVESTQLRVEAAHRETYNWLGAFGFQATDRDFSALGEEAFVPPSSSELIGAYILEETKIGRGTVAFGLRVDRQELSSEVEGNIDHTSFNASLSYLLPLGDSQRLSFIIGSAERAPVAEELLSDGEHIATNTFEIGDANLETEQSFNAEINWALSTETVSARASIFYSDFSEYIYLQNTGSSFLEQEGLSGLDACSDDVADFGGVQDALDDAVDCFLFVQEGAVFTGAEAEIVFNASRYQQFRFWGDFVQAELDDNGDVPRIPPARVGASWDYERASWSGGVSVTQAFDQDNPGEGEEETEGYTRVDAHIGWSTEDYRFFLKGSNLGDEDIRNSTSFLRELAPEPGRSFSIGAVYRF